MIEGVQDFYYNVQDMQKAVRFYTEALGMRCLEESEYWTSLDCSGVRIGLHWTGGEPVPSVLQDTHGARAGGTLTLQSNDIEKDRHHVESFGVKILGEEKAPWGHMLVFEDPDGNVLKLMNPSSLRSK